MPQRIVRKVNGRALAGALVGAVLVLLAAIGYAYNNSQERIDKTGTALEALCLQREDLDARIAQTRKLLAMHPHQRLIFALPRQLLVDSLRQSEKTRQNLEILDC
jgi:hypothetical protein